MGLYPEDSTSCLLLDGEPSQYTSDCSTVQLPQVAHKGKKHHKSSSRYAATTAEQAEAAEAAAAAATTAHTLFAMGLDSEQCDHTMRRMQQRLRPAYARQLAWLVLVKAGAAAMTAAKPMLGPDAAVKRTVPLPLAGYEDAILAIHRVPNSTGDFVSAPLNSCASRSELEGCSSGSVSRWQGSNSAIDVRCSSRDLQQQQCSVYEINSGLQSGSLQTIDATTATSTTTMGGAGSHLSATAAAVSDAGVWRESVSHSSSSRRAAKQRSQSLTALSLTESSLCNNSSSVSLMHEQQQQQQQQQQSVLSLAAQLRAAVPSTRDRDAAAELSRQQARARAADAVQRRLNSMLAEAARRTQAAQDKAVAAQNRARQTLWLQLVLHSARLAHFQQAAAALGAARLRKQHERQLLSATLCVQKLWRAYYLRQFMAQNQLKLLPVTRMGMKWRLMCRARKKRACQPLLLFVVREAAMASKVDIAITSFRMYYRRLHSAAAAFVHCRRARVLALLKLWVLEEPVSTLFTKA
jgi:hypothetical protein